MIIGLVIILLLILVLPFVVKKVEENLEYFLFVMGLAAIIVSGVLSPQFLMHTFTNYLIYTITGAVLIAGLLFTVFVDKLKSAVNWIVTKIPLKVFVFLIIVLLGLASSIITAIVASLLLVEIVNALPVDREKKIKINIVACFSIGLGAVLTPVGEPLATIVISALKADFFYLFRNLGADILPAICILGLFGAYLSSRESKNTVQPEEESPEEIIEPWSEAEHEPNEPETEKEGFRDVFVRAGKIFVFIVALEFLGAGFKPLIDTYVVQLDSRILYFINMLSAILDNATLAAAEISTTMSDIQIKAVLLGLLISGGMLIPGNIPNIISAGKLKIASREWAKLGVPLGLVILLAYFVIIFML